MNTTAMFYRDRARQAEADADSATLDNVRDRWSRAAKAWDEMATRAEKTAERRSANEEAKAMLGEEDQSFDATRVPIRYIGSVLFNHHHADRWQMPRLACVDRDEPNAMPSIRTGLMACPHLR